MTSPRQLKVASTVQSTNTWGVSWPWDSDEWLKLLISLQILCLSDSVFHTCHSHLQVGVWRVLQKLKLPVYFQFLQFGGDFFMSFLLINSHSLLYMTCTTWIMHINRRLSNQFSKTALSHILSPSCRDFIGKLAGIQTRKYFLRYFAASVRALNTAGSNLSPFNFNLTFQLHFSSSIPWWTLQKLVGLKLFFQLVKSLTKHHCLIVYCTSRTFIEAY